MKRYMTFDLKKRLVLVAGGTGEVGKTVTAHFIKYGAEVMTTYLSEAEVGAFKADFPAESKRVFFARMDMLDFDRAQQAVDDLVARKGVPDILVNLADSYPYGPSVAECEPGDMARMIELNFTPVFNLCRCVLPHMLENGRGKIVNVGARAGRSGTGQFSGYSVAKAAVVRFTETLSAEVKDRGINVNCVLPSIVDTETNRQDMPDAEFSDWVTPEELAEVILFLSSESGRAIHGASIPVYGRI